MLNVNGKWRRRSEILTKLFIKKIDKIINLQNEKWLTRKSAMSENDGANVDGSSCFCHLEDFFIIINSYSINILI